MDADTTIEMLKDIISGNEHKHSAADKDQALKIFLADLAKTARNSSKAAGRIPVEPLVSPPSSRT
jgi:hypothetical protein